MNKPTPPTRLSTTYQLAKLFGMRPAQVSDIIIRSPDLKRYSLTRNSTNVTLVNPRDFADAKHKLRINRVPE